MHVTIAREALLKALGFVSGAVERRATIPVLLTLRLEARDGALFISATNLDQRAEAEAPTLSITTPGAVCAFAETLSGFARKLPAEASVEIAAIDGRLEVRAGRARMNCPTLPAEDFPAFDAHAPAHAFDMPAADLRYLIERTRFAMSNEATRYYLNGLYLHVRAEIEAEPRLASAATDGARLALATVPAPEGAADIAGAIVPRGAVDDIVKLIDGADLVRVELSRATLRVAVPGAALLTKLVEGTFPEYQRVIPKPTPESLEARLARADLIAALSRVTIVSQDKSRSVKLAFADGAVRASARNPDAFEASDECPADFDGACDVGFDGRMLAEILAQTAGEDIALTINANGAPMIARDPADPHCLAVLMPLRVA